MNIKQSDRQDHMNSIICDVKNCVYHDGEDHCSAAGIQVGPTYAVSPADTVCATFKGK